MGVPLSRIEREFVLKSLHDDRIVINVHGLTWDINGNVSSYNDFEIEVEVVHGDTGPIVANEDVNIFFAFQNNNLTFASRVERMKGSFLYLRQPEEIFKNSHRGYTRVKVNEKIMTYFYLQSKRYELSFPRVHLFVSDDKPVYADNFDTSSIAELIRSFQKKMVDSVSEHKIVMLKDRLTEAYEEKLLLKTCKILWIQSTSRELPTTQPFIDDRVIIKQDIEQYELEQKTAPFHIVSKVKDFLFQKKLKGIHAELYCPIIHRDYLVGYIYVVNKDNFKKEITDELVEYVDQFSKVLSYSLKENGYFKSTLNTVEMKYEAPIIDLSASGLLFSHTSPELDRELLVFRRLNVHFEINAKTMLVDSWIIRKFKDKERFYFGIQFQKIEQEDFCALYEFLYRKPFSPQGKYMW